MSKFDHYYLMNTEQVKEYAVEVLHYFDSTEHLVCREIGDGNINYVFRVVDRETQRSVIIKQAGVTTRISQDIHLSTDRNRIESEILQLQYRLVPGSVPEVYLYDEVMCVMAMQDLTGHVIMRTALLQRQRLPRFVDDITTFLVNTLLATTDVVMEHKEKKGAGEAFYQSSAL